MAMNTEAIFAIALAVATALMGFLAGSTSRRTRLAGKSSTTWKPLPGVCENRSLAAFNLQSRLYNIVRQSLLSRMHTDLRSAEDQEYVVEYTLYLIGHTSAGSRFCAGNPCSWTHQEARGRAVADQLEKVRDAFAESETIVGPFRLFRGEQRAIGECMIMARPGDDADNARMDWIGLCGLHEQREQPETVRWFRGILGQSCMTHGMRSSPHFGRLVVVQRALVGLVHMLDPDALRVSAGMRETL